MANIDVKELLRMSSVKRFPDGAVIVKEGDTVSDDMFIILQGSAGVYKNYGQANQLFIVALSIGEFVGEMSLFLKQGRTATVIAVENVIALRLNSANVTEFFQTQPAAVFGFIKTICGRLDATSKAYEKLVGVVGNAQAAAPSAPTAKPVAATSPVPAAHIPAPAPVPTPAPAAPAAAPIPASAASLFPEGHGQYNLPLSEQDFKILLAREQKCPVCEHVFKAPLPLDSKLIKLREDPDSRVHYKGIETMYYTTLVCPKCLFSAVHPTFSKARVKRKAEAQEALKPYVGKLPLKLGSAPDLDTFTVFASYYLALKSAVAYADKDMMEAVLWLRLSRLYEDCGDKAMTNYADIKALSAYKEGYSKTELSPQALQRVCFTIGDLAFKTGDFGNARKFLFEAKQNKDGLPVIKEQAENRLEDLKKAEAQKED
ncbi:hypothetical protein AGMMS50276_02840 [Synergistales bacterium]|nr:hypothetical protein AGMMS50276_02840 [Synergistales bacterium]